MTSPFYRSIEERFCQGDIFSSAPTIYLSDRYDKPRAMELGATKNGYHTDELSWLSPDGSPCGLNRKSGSKVIMPVETLVNPAILLSHGCEVDKYKEQAGKDRPRLIAMIRSLAKAPNEQTKDAIRNGQAVASFFLPSSSEQFPESFVDFRRISNVSE